MTPHCSPLVLCELSAAFRLLSAVCKAPSAPAARFAGSAATLCLASLAPSPQPSSYQRDVGGADERNASGIRGSVGSAKTAEPTHLPADVAVSGRCGENSLHAPEENPIERGFP